MRPRSRKRRYTGTASPFLKCSTIMYRASGIGNLHCQASSSPSLYAHQAAVQVNAIKYLARCRTIWRHMADEHPHRAAERIRVELIEADVEIGFGLVDSALGE